MDQKRRTFIFHSFPPNSKQGFSCVGHSGAMDLARTPSLPVDFEGGTHQVSHVSQIRLMSYSEVNEEDFPQGRLRNPRKMQKCEEIANVRRIQGKHADDIDSTADSCRSLEVKGNAPNASGACHVPVNSNVSQVFSK